MACSSIPRAGDSHLFFFLKKLFEKEKKEKEKKGKRLEFD